MSKIVKHTTPNGRLVVVLETGRQKSADGEFFAVLNGREPTLTDLPDRYLIEDAPGQGFGQTYAAPDFDTLDEAVAYSNALEAKGSEISALARRIGFHFDREMDRLAALIENTLPDDHDSLQELVKRKDWRGQDEARDIVRRVHEVARGDVRAFAEVVEKGDRADNPGVMDAWLLADATPGIRWGLDHRICNVINAELRRRGLPTGDWSWREWMRVVAGTDPMEKNS